MSLILIRSLFKWFFIWNCCKFRMLFIYIMNGNRKCLLLWDFIGVGGKLVFISILIDNMKCLCSIRYFKNNIKIIFVMLVFMVI